MGLTKFRDKEELEHRIISYKRYRRTKKSIYWGFGERVSAFETNAAWSRGIPYKNSKSPIICFLVYFLVVFIIKSKRLSKVGTLLVWGWKYAGPRGSYNPKKGNHLQNFKIINQIVSFFSFHCFLCYIKKSYHM